MVGRNPAGVAFVHLGRLIGRIATADAGRKAPFEVGEHVGQAVAAHFGVHHRVPDRPQPDRARGEVAVHELAAMDGAQRARDLLGEQIGLGHR